MQLISRRIGKLSLWICLIICIAACASPSNPTASVSTPTAPPSPPEWFLSWLKNPTCPPPCFEMITPGATSANNIYPIQEQYPQLHVVTKKDAPTILKIYLSLAYDKVPAKLLVEKYGQPDYVRLYKCDPGICETHIIYEKLGMVLNLGLLASYNQSGWTVDISPESNIFELYFIETGLESYWYSFSGSPRKMDKWMGYGAYTSND